ncbi:MAG: protein phosphatase CheZ [Alphaproteobacteria bacterium]|nr:protein phosphatase CheZ [Alphaproteobacteria bacterium]
MTTDQQPGNKLESNLSAEIKAAHNESSKACEAKDIASIVRQVISTLTGDINSADLKFYSELQELAGYIKRAKQEIAEIQPEDISASKIPGATDELDAVVGATEEATNKIMDVCDEISAIAAECPPENNEKLVACTTRIYEACNFQDITGQRITKVVQTLKYIDSKVEALLRALGDEVGRSDDGSSAKETMEDPDKLLVNGPQLPQNAIDQSEIDRLLGN